MDLIVRVPMLLILTAVLGLGLFGVLCEEKKNYKPVAYFAVMITTIIIATNPIV